MRKTLGFLWLVLVWSGVGVSQCPFEVIEYRPAPGQFVDESEFLREGQDAGSLSQERICADLNAKFDEFPFSHTISLGAFGGMVTVKMKEPIWNRPGADFKVYGNAFYNPAYTPALTDTPGGSAEPGIVWVSRDDNGNGLADDPWYELAGSMYGDTNYIKDYTVTYYEPDSIGSDIFWKDNRGECGYVYRNSFHTQDSYYPRWVGRDSLVFTGGRLPGNARFVEQGSGQAQWILFAYVWGYADNHPNMSDLSNMNIDWAVDASGQPVHLDRIDFVRVVNAMNQHPDRNIGETSTEFAGVEPLPENAAAEKDIRSAVLRVYPNPCTSFVRIEPVGPMSFPPEDRPELFDLSGRKLAVFPPIRPGDCWQADMQGYAPGVYLLRWVGRSVKIVKR